MERLATKTIPCAECRQGIQTRRDLAVAGKLLQPYHRSCINSPVSKLGRLHRFYGTFPLGGAILALVVGGECFPDHGREQRVRLFLDCRAVLDCVQLGVRYRARWRLSQLRATSGRMSSARRFLQRCRPSGYANVRRFRLVACGRERDDGHAEQGKQAGFGDRQVRDECQELDKQSFSY